MYCLIQRRGNVGSTLFKEEDEGDYGGVEHFIERFDLTKQCVDFCLHLHFILNSLAYSPGTGSILTIPDSELEVPSPQVSRDSSMEVEEEDDTKGSTPELVPETRDTEPLPPAHRESSISDPPISSSRLSVEIEKVPEVEAPEPSPSLDHPEVEAVEQESEAPEQRALSKPRFPSSSLPTSQEIPESSVRDESPVVPQLSSSLDEPPPDCCRCARCRVRKHAPRRCAVVSHFRPAAWGVSLFKALFTSTVMFIPLEVRGTIASCPHACTRTRTHCHQGRTGRCRHG